MACSNDLAEAVGYLVKLGFDPGLKASLTLFELIEPRFKPSQAFLLLLGSERRNGGDGVHTFGPSSALIFWVFPFPFP